jgi:RNA polymerase sigma factor (sigma-70 family)
LRFRTRAAWSAGRTTPSGTAGVGAATIGGESWHILSTDSGAAVCDRVMMTDGVAPTLTFEEFYVREFPRLVPMLAAWCGSVATAEDLAQDALVAASCEWDKVKGLESPGAWVRRVALNRSSNAGRRRRREGRAMSRIRDASTRSAAMPDLPDTHLWSRVRALPRAQRSAVVLYYVDDLSLADIAAVLGCTDGTVKTHLQRARVALASSMEAETER